MKIHTLLINGVVAGVYSTTGKIEKAKREFHDLHKDQCSYEVRTFVLDSPASPTARNHKKDCAVFGLKDCATGRM